jgi:putative peptidoglycan lipid II flippase
MKTRVRIAIVVLVATQLLNIVLVPPLRHAGLALSISLGAMLNAGWLLVGLLRRGTYKPSPGWGLFLLQVFAGSALLAVFLMWASGAFPWLAWNAQKALRAAVLGGLLAAAAALYFVALAAAGVKLRQFVTR